MQEALPLSPTMVSDHLMSSYLASVNAVFPNKAKKKVPARKPKKAAATATATATPTTPTPTTAAATPTVGASAATRRSGVRVDARQGDGESWDEASIQEDNGTLAASVKKRKQNGRVIHSFSRGGGGGAAPMPTK